MIRRFQIVFVSCLLLCLTGCMVPEQKECMRLRETYGVHIHPVYNRQKFFPKHWLRVPVLAKGTQIAPKEMDRLLPIVEEFLSKCPRRILQTNLSDIYLLGKLELYGTSFANQRFSSKSSLYVSSEVKSGGFCELPLQDRVYSAFSGILLSNYMYLFPTDAWKAVDSNGWLYMSTLEERLAMKDPYEQTEGLLSRGFLTKCSQNTLFSDFAMLSVWVFTRPEQLQELASRHNRIKEKCELTRQFYDKINNIDMSSGPWKQKKLELESTYGIDIVFDNVRFPQYWKGFRPRWAAIPADSRWQALNNLQIDLSKYKPGFLKKNINNIFLCRDLAFMGQTYGGTVDYRKKWIYLTAGALGDNGLVAEFGGFHHEFSSVLLGLYKKNFPRKAWEESNPTGFKYVFEQGSWRNLTTGKTRVSGNAGVYSEGFVCDYGQVAFEDDVNTYAQYLIGKPEMLEVLAAEYPLIGQKTALLKRFYKAIGFERVRDD